MHIYGNLNLLESESIKALYPVELLKDLQTAIKAVAECNGGKNESCVIVAESEAELQIVETEYELNDRYSEIDTDIAAGSECWRKRVFVFDDYGSGVIIYSRTSSGNEKRTE